MEVVVNKIFYPENLLVVGVSEKSDNLARNITENIINFGFKGKLQLLGRQAGSIKGFLIHTAVKELVKDIDVAIVITPAQTVPALVNELGEIGVRNIVIESAGFSEFSEEGRLLEEEIGRIAEKWNIKIVGPNCVGIICTDSGINTVFIKYEKEEVKPGNVSLISQSGGVVLTIADFLSANNLGITKAVSVGNKLNLKEAEYLEYFQQDQSTQMILMYLESIEEGRKLIENAEKGEKPVIIYKSNTSRASAEIAMSHTAALSNDDQLVSSALEQFGITRVHSFREMVNAGKGLSLPPVKGNKLAVFSRSGGQAVVSVDVANELGFELPEFPDELIEIAKPFFRVNVIDRQNPLDLGTVFNFYSYPIIVEETIKIIHPDAILLIFNYRREIHPKAKEIALKLKDLSQRYQTPIALCYFTEMDTVLQLERELEFPIYTEVNDAIRSLAISRDFYSQKAKRSNYLKYGKYFQTPQSSKDNVIQILKEVENNEIQIGQAMEICQQYGLPVAEHCITSSEVEAIEFAESVKYPVVIKIAGSGSIHKTDVGGVVLNIQNGAGVKEAFAKISANLEQHGMTEAPKFLVQKMLTSGKEIIVGGKQDPAFGPTILCGLGGIYAEVLQDVNVKLAPVFLEEAKEMIAGLKGFKYLSGVRGEKGVNIDHLAETLVRVSQLMTDFPQISELDLNPVLAFEKEVSIVDARIILKSQD